MKKLLNNILAIILITLIVFLISTIGNNTSKATDEKVATIGVGILENGKIVASRNYDSENDKWNEVSGTILTEIPWDGKNFKIGKKYKEEMAVENTGSIDCYVRVMIIKKWLSKNDDDFILDENLIQVNVLENNGWVVHKDSSSEERIVMYYRYPLNSGKSTPIFMDSIRIDPNIQKEYRLIQNGNNTSIVNKYDNRKFSIEIETGVVQTHDAEEAIRSVWGIEVSVDKNGTLTILQ